mmetsp:Transcript_96891/g.269519  ORF Transcript_96891/g.269519 Transcript_96891/m.269519 type:complete len:546 (+) Transcript_96891:63-1700(+)|eukprot:CAMPEP_0179026892 /NCGR_PEP_ID=MMETSP0796-20121207/8754_1 /TAXON_ID=73915 /ORGANISM="Pyrodinium bahamense, Strain pbaha01" /LENGTH=545 /DNA_ID=CAMNT_0020722997 /DNA_START=61 /DNA_END=1698 /DNA_ORIENTATION=-
MHDSVEMEREPAARGIRDHVEAQDWALRRFAGISPEHIGTSFCIISLSDLSPPPGFETVWRPATPSSSDPNFSGVLSPDIPTLRAVLVLGDLFKKRELLTLANLMQAMEETFNVSKTPPLYLLQHTVAPEIRTNRAIHGISEMGTLRTAMECGLENMTKTEASGFRLALDIRMLIQHNHHTANTMNLYVFRLRDMHGRRERLKAQIHNCLWQFGVVKFCFGIIPITDPFLPTGIPPEVGGWEVGEFLGIGTLGSVYAIRQPPTPAQPEGRRRVLAAVDKGEVRTHLELKRIKRTIQIMQLLSSEWQHPGIIKLFEVYHSRSHLLLCMEYPGSQSLFKRLEQRDLAVDQLELSVGKAGAIITQAAAAVVHLHLGPAVCHRDIKTEKFMILETPNEPRLQLKLADFNLAIAMSRASNGPCGSFPFVAPEAILETHFDGGAADIWSLSVVLLEVLCRTRILETALDLAVSPQGLEDIQGAATKIKQHFEAEGRVASLLQQYGRPELSQLNPLLGPTLKRTLHVDPAHRWDAQQVSEALGALRLEDLEL